MMTLLKALFACALGIGFLALGVHAKPSVAFLGLGHDSDPLIKDNLTRRIQWRLGADTSLASLSSDQVSEIYTKGLLTEPEAGPADLPRLAKEVGAQYYAYGWLEALTYSDKRVLWMPWSVKTHWSQNMHLRMLDGANGKVVYDGVVPAEFTDKNLFFGPEENWAKMNPTERDVYIRRLVEVLSVESAKTVSRVMNEKTGSLTGASASAASAAGGASAPAATP